MMVWVFAAQPGSIPASQQADFQPLWAKSPLTALGAALGAPAAPHLIMWMASGSLEKLKA